MVDEAREPVGIHPNIVIKVPLTVGRLQGRPALADEDIRRQRDA